MIPIMLKSTTLEFGFIHKYKVNTNIFRHGFLLKEKFAYPGYFR